MIEELSRMVQSNEKTLTSKMPQIDSKISSHESLLSELKSASDKSLGELRQKAGSLEAKTEELAQNLTQV